MKYLISLVDTSAWQTIRNKLGVEVVSQCHQLTARLDHDVLVEVPLQVRQLAQLVEETTAELVVFYPQPELAIAGNLSDSQNDLSVAARQWEEQILSLMQLYKLNRRRIKLLNLDQCLLGPENAREALRKLNITLDSVKWDRPTDSVQTMAVCQYFTQHANLLRLSELLYVSSLPVADGPSWCVDVQTVYDHHLQQGAITQKREENSQAQLSDLQDALHLSRQQLDEYARQINACEASINSQKNIIDELNAKLADQLTREQSLNDQKSSLFEENELLIANLHQVQEELEQQYLKFRGLEVTCADITHQQKIREREEKKLTKHIGLLRGQLASVQYQRGILQKELEAIKSSALWRSATPVRFFNKVLRRNREQREQLQADCILILTSDYFDVDWYLQTYKDVAESDTDPAEHYLLFGADEGRNPGPKFDSNWYLRQNPDVVELGLNPLLHFIKHGQAEGRQPSLKLLEKLGIEA